MSRQQGGRTWRRCGHPKRSTAGLSRKIVQRYLSHHQLPAGALGNLISTVHEALRRAGTEPAPTEATRTPAVPIRRSIHRDYVVCIECGKRGKVLRRHLMSVHGLTVEEYRARWNLPAHHPTTARAFSEQRSALAKQTGLGHDRRRVSRETTAVPEARARTPAKPAAKRRRSPRSASRTA